MYFAITLSLSVLFFTVAPLAHAAFTCPPMPTAVTGVNRDIKSDISASVGSLGKVKLGEIGIKTEIEAKNLFAKYPNVDKLLALQTMSATYCDMLKNTTAITDVEKLDRWERFQDKVLDLRSSPPKGPQGKAQPSVGTAAVAKLTPIEARTELGKLSLSYTPRDFVQSAKMGDLTAVNLFLTAGMDPNSTPGRSPTALMEASSNGHTKIVAALVTAGADVKKSYSIDTALSLAASNGHVDILRVLIGKGTDVEAINNAFIDAAGHRRLDAMRLLVERGAEVKKRGVLGLTFLMQRSGGLPKEEGEHDGEVSRLVKFLLDLGADPNGKDPHGWTPLLAAAYGPYPSAIRLLLDRGAAINAKCDCPNTGYGGSTALMLAAQRDGLASVVALLGKGADVSQRNDKGETALTVAENSRSEKAKRIADLIKGSKAQ
jgi:ankyrin repeat protein